METKTSSNTSRTNGSGSATNQRRGGIRRRQTAARRGRRRNGGGRWLIRELARRARGRTPAAGPAPNLTRVAGDFDGAGTDGGPKSGVSWVQGSGSVEWRAGGRPGAADCGGASGRSGGVGGGARIRFASGWAHPCAGGRSRGRLNTVRRGSRV